MRMEDKKRAEEWYEKINKQFEEDCKTHDFSDPEMDKWFVEMLDKKMRKSRKCKIAKVASIAAGVVLLMSVVLNGFTQVVYGESLFNIIKNSVKAGRFSITAFSQNDDSQFEDFENEILSYEADSIEDVFEQIATDANTEIDELFFVSNLPTQYRTWDIKYNKKLHRLTIRSHRGEDYLYILEELNYENVVSGTILESNVVTTIFNENLEMEIDIVEQMSNIRKQGYYLEVFCNSKYMKIEGNGTLEEFELLAKTISMLEVE